MPYFINRKIKKQLLTIAALAGLALTCTTETFAQAATLRFAPLPMENRETLLRQFRPLAKFLETKLGVTIEFDFSDNYAEIIKKFSSGQIDLAYLGPLPYVELRAQYQRAQALVHFNEASGKPMYTCALVTIADTPLNLKEVKNRRFALTQPLSTCGYLAVNGLLQEQGSQLANNRYQYLDKHDTVALAVVRGEFDAGGLKTAIGKKYAHLGLTILAETPPLPSFSLVANQATLSAETMEAIRTALTRLDPEGADKELLHSWGENIRYGAVPAADSDYAIVRKFKGNLEIPTTDKMK